MNKLEQVSTDDHRMSLGGGPPFSKVPCPGIHYDFWLLSEEIVQNGKTLFYLV